MDRAESIAVETCSKQDGSICFQAENEAVAITLRNKALEAKIKEIGRRTGLGPSAVIARAIENEDARTSTAQDALVRRRIEAGRRLRAELPTLDADDRAAIDRAMEEMYDEDGLPKY